ncbi:MAG TPA: Asp-tRNA(Asn)/Glu-tRNA(Gln) amidotransferase subunit GatA [Patescibacteria group bacterium]|nr:Asp-tRNA(Asn)/Glu-tRNA(Gln) amidotransferase subunit GatA [Patescibacteria group bacterium]
MNLNTLTIKDAIDQLRKKNFSSYELTSSCLEEIEKKKELNAFITVDKQGALNQAGHADIKIKDGADLPLLGIPIALKDIFLTKGLRTTAGSKVLEDYIPQYDATVVRKLYEAGAVIIGKTNLDAWAHGSSGENSDFGPTKNPFDKTRVPGGSSSGSAVAVASDMALAATGSDTGGSIRLPASFCNIVGLKPTYGRVSRYGIISMASSMDSIGHFTKTVEDSAIFLNVTAGKDPMDATTPPKEVPDYTKNLKETKKIKIGIPKEYFGEGLDKKVKEQIEKAVSFFEKEKFEIIEVSLPHTEYAIACYYVIQPSEVSSNLARYDGIRYGSARQNFGDEAVRRIMLGTFTLSSGYVDAYYKKAMKVRTLIKKDFDEVFKKVDVLISPVSPALPWKLGEKANDPLAMYLSDALTVPANIAGIPGLSVPIGMVGELPVGMQILGNHFAESTLFNLGHFYENNNRT